MSASSEVLGFDGGSSPTEEDGVDRGEAVGALPGSKEVFSEVQGSSSQTTSLHGIHHDAEQESALQDILEPPRAPDLINQVIKEGLRQSPGLAPNSVVVLAEMVPTWLSVVDSWGSHRIFLYCEGEKKAYREELDLVTPVSSFLTVAGLAGAGWKNDSSRVVIIQGSEKFCSKMVAGLQSLGLDTRDKIVLTTNDKVRNLALSFKF